MRGQSSLDRPGLHDLSLSQATAPKVGWRPPSPEEAATAACDTGRNSANNPPANLVGPVQRWSPNTIVLPDPGRFGASTGAVSVSQILNHGTGHFLEPASPMTRA